MSGLAQVLVAAGDELGEGPHWGTVTGELLRVDITRGQVHRLDPVSGRASSVDVGDLRPNARPNG